ncbi:MAG TPA: hypothetical protein VHS99_01675 [Chloroflexota bacterium]|nr:hypothetical protein [Chloroflexota bacterium]
MRGGPRLLCRGCVTAVAEARRVAAEQGRPLARPRRAWQTHRASVVAGGCIAAVLAVLAISVGGMLFSPAYRAGMEEAVERAGMAFALSGGTAGGGGRLGAGPEVPPTPLARPGGNDLIDGMSADDGSAGGQLTLGRLTRDERPIDLPWQSQTDAVPVQLSFTLREPAVLDRVAFRHTQASPPPSWAREVEVLLSAAEGDAGWVPAGRWTLAQTTAPQEFSFRPTLTRRIRVRLLSRYGEAVSTSLGTFAIGVQVRDRSPLLPP